MPIENKPDVSSDPNAAPELLTDDSLTPDEITARKNKTDLQCSQQSSEEKDDISSIHPEELGPPSRSHLPENLERDIQRQQTIDENIRLKDLVQPEIPVEVLVHPPPRLEPVPTQQISLPSTKVSTDGSLRSSEEKDDSPNIHLAGLEPTSRSHLPENLERDIQRQQRIDENICLEVVTQPHVPVEAEVFLPPPLRLEPEPSQQVPPPSTLVCKEGSLHSSEEKDVPNIHQAGLGPNPKSHLPENLERDIQRRQQRQNENIRLEDFIQPDIPAAVEVFVHPPPRLEPGPPQQISPPSTQVGSEAGNESEASCLKFLNKRWVIGGVALGVSVAALCAIIYVCVQTSHSDSTAIIEHATNVSLNVTDFVDHLD